MQTLDKLYASFPCTNFFLRSIRYSMRIIANLYVKFFYFIDNKKHNVDKNTIIISLTSFPARIRNVWMTCATLLNQDIDNKHIVLWLSNLQFKNQYKDLPKNLLKLQSKGLDIRFVDDDLRPHKKYFYAFQEYPDNVVVTVDDDILYNPELVSELIKIYHQHSDCVICNRSVNIRRDKYSKWCTNTVYKKELANIMPTGIGGVLYPPHIFDNSPVFDVDAIKSTCINGDDLWLNFMTRLNGHLAVQTEFRTGLITVLSSQEDALCKENVGENKNDLQINKISQWAKGKFGFDFFHNCE